tara:strand:+ start:166 stop:1452 length:1287 start_codon:yes stop_codon:yes gene_type:complete
MAIKRKKKVARSTQRRGIKGLVAPSNEDIESWTGEELHRRSTACHAWWYDNYKTPDLIPAVFEWMEKNNYTKEQIKFIKAAPNYTISGTAAICCRMLLDGWPDWDQRESDYWDTLPGTMGKTKPKTEFIIKRIEMAIAEGKTVIKDRKDVEEKKAKIAPPLSIQERIREQAYAQSEAIEEWLEGFTTDKESFDPKGFDFKKHFQKMAVSQAHARKLKSFYDGELNDFKSLLVIPTAGQLKKMSEKEADDWEQLKEGYAHLSKADVKKYISAIESLEQALDFVIDSAKANRKPRKSKPKSASKLVEKLKYCKADEKFKIASITPEDIIKANELWVFNKKNRKIGKYIAKNIDPQGQQRDGTGLSIKGTTVIGYDEELSIQKTLRKPEEQLRQFKECGKVKLRTFLDDIKTTDTKLNGRCNPDTILLKVN